MREFLSLVNEAEVGAVVTVTEEMKEVAAAGLASLDKAAEYKKSYESKSKKETAERAEKVYAALVEIGEPATCTRIGEVTGYSTHRVSALLGKLGERVSKAYTSKGVPVFSAVAE